LADEYRVIVPDMVGYGNSDHDDSFDRSIRAQEEMISDLLNGLNVGPVTFVGHDLGGGVGLRYAVHEPDAVENLVLSNAVCYDSWPIQQIVDLGLPSTIESMSVDDLQGMIDEMFRGGLYSDDVDEAFIEGMKVPWNTEQGKISLSRNAIGTNTSHTTEIDPSEITARTLLLWGVDDEFQPISSAERLEKDISDAELVGLDNANHWVIEDRTDAYRNELREFLDSET
jgi:pimeloyl-ACP methyl ester carboxylesterase